jgi:hypothetical protein
MSRHARKHLENNGLVRLGRGWDAELSAKAEITARRGVSGLAKMA